MGRRIEVELTSTRDDGSWTWRAAGAREPKGELPAKLLYDGVKVGDVVNVEAEFHVDGIEVVEVFAPKQKKARTNILEMKSQPLRQDELVTTQRVSRDDRRGGRRGSRTRDDRRRRPDGERSRNRTPPSEVEARPKPKRLRPKRVHRDTLLAEVGDEHRPIVEQVIKDGMPGVRAAIERQKAEAKEAGKPEFDAAPILAIAEKNLPKARLAEWRDRADAALATVDDLDLRDLRSVVVAGTDVARSQESREIADKLKASLDERVESDHAAWLADLESAIGDGRVVRALRLSSRPVKAGAPLPSELASKLATQASEALAPDVGQERWATVLDALAFSPVRGAVTPVGFPPEPKTELLDAVKRLADRIPAIAAPLGIDPAQVPRSAKRRRPPRKDGARGKGPGGAGDKGRRPKLPPSPSPDADTAPTTRTTDADTPPDSSTTAPKATTDNNTASEITVESAAAPAAQESADPAATTDETAANAKDNMAAAPDEATTATADDAPSETSDTSRPDKPDADAATETIDVSAEATDETVSDESQPVTS